MKNALYIINGVLVVAVGVLFYLFLTEKKHNSAAVVQAKNWVDTTNSPTRIAYFEWDSIENQKFYKDMQGELNSRRDQVDKEKLKLSQIYQDRLESYSKKPMSQVESEKAAQDMRNLEENLRSRMDKMEQGLNDFALRKKVEFNDKIREFLKQYNQQRGFTYIIANEPGFIFYRDSAFNITADVVAGLNQIYSKK